MSIDDRFRDVDWDELARKLALRARHLFATAKARGLGNALARVGADPDDLANSVILEALRYDKVKYKPSKGASLSTFLTHVLEADFLDLLRKGRRLTKRLERIAPAEHTDADEERVEASDCSDRGHGAEAMDLRAAAMHAAKDDPELLDYVTAAFDCGAVTRADQALFLKVPPSEITNLRKRFLRLFPPGPTDSESGDEA